MKPRDRVLASIRHEASDRLPIKHLAVAEVDDLLRRHFGVQTQDELLDILGHDFREVAPEYRGPAMANLESEHGIISARVWARAIEEQRPGVPFPLAEACTVSDLDRFSFPSPDWYDDSTIAEQCRRHAEYARILGYCELDFFNGISGLRGEEQVLLDIGTRDPVYLELVERRFQFVYEHLRRGLEAGAGLVDFVHLGEDLGSQQGLLISTKTFLEVFGEKYQAAIDLAHRHGARVMLHSCGSVVQMIPTLIDLGLDVLDVVQTNAVGMDLGALKARFGDRLTFAGTMCVQRVLPFGSTTEVRQEVERRLEMFRDGGLIIGPSHQLQVDCQLANILEMYREARG